MSEYYVIVGTFTNKKGNDKGIHVYQLNTETGCFKHLKQYLKDCAAGFLCFDNKRSVLYACDERDHANDENARIYALKMNMNDGSLKALNYIDSLMNKPCYFSIGKNGKYGAYSCHTNRRPISRVIKHEDGSFGCIQVYDSGGVGTVELNTDGSLKEIKDIYTFNTVQDGDRVKQPHCHSANFEKSGTMFVSGDKGLDKIYAFMVDDEGKINKISETDTPKNTSPRYSVYHPKLNIVYVNCEQSNILYAYSYDTSSGLKEKLQEIELVDTSCSCEPSDLCILEDGTKLYAAVRGANCICVFSIEENGKLKKLQNISSGEKGSVRALQITPDNRFLITTHPSSNELKLFEIMQDGLLKFHSRIECKYAAALTVIEKCTE